MSPLLAIFLAGCGAGSHAASEAYATEMAPLFQKNLALGSEFLDVASLLKQQQVDAAGVAARFNQTAVPLAKELATRAGEVKPGDEKLASAHATLVEAWTTRATAYQHVGEAWTKGDRAALDAAREEALKARTLEQTYLDSVNAYTHPAGVDIQLYPGS